jgi:hypothetical protein
MRRLRKAGRHAFVYSLVVTYVVAFGLTAKAQDNSAVLVPGAPPLTQAMVDKSAALIQWALEISISAENKSKLQNVLVRAWQTRNSAEMKSTLDIIEVHDNLMRMGPADRDARRPSMQAAILENLRKDTDDEMSRSILSAYEETRTKNGASRPSEGKPGQSAKSGMRVGEDGFTGVYRMVRPRAISINNSGYEPGYWIEYITFLPDGHVYWTLPPEGLLYFDPAVAQRAHPNDWGTYEIKNGEIHILRGPERRPYVITRTGDRLNNPPSLGKGSFRRVPPADGLRLDGTYRRGATEPTISFTQDSRFQDAGIFGNFGTGQRPDGTIYQDDGRGGSGTYIIDQYTLELKYSDGRVRRVPFIAFPENLAKKPYLDSFILRREERMQRQ